MNEPSAAAVLLEPLLMELARAVRACQFYGREHPTRDHALRKASSIWQQGLARTGELDLLVADHGFELRGERALSGPALDDLARTLQLHHVVGLQVHTRWGHEGRETLEEHQRLEHHVRCAVAPGPAQLIVHAAPCRTSQAMRRQGRSSDVATTRSRRSRSEPGMWTAACNEKPSTSAHSGGGVKRAPGAP